jgi:hypothetical protein
MIDTPDPQQNFDALAGRRIVDIHVWAVREGLRGTEPAMLFMGLCQRLVDAGVPVWRAFAWYAHPPPAMGRLQLYVVARRRRYQAGAVSARPPLCGRRSCGIGLVSFQQRGDGGFDRLEAAGIGLAEQRLTLGECLLDRAQVRALFITAIRYGASLIS